MAKSANKNSLNFHGGPGGIRTLDQQVSSVAYELRQAFCRSSLAEHPGIRLGSESIRARAQHYRLAKVEYAFRWEDEWCSGRDFQRLLAFEPASLTFPNVREASILSALRILTGLYSVVSASTGAHQCPEQSV